MRASLFASIALAVAARTAESAQVVIANKCSETLRIGVYCRDHSRWEPIVGNFLAASVVSNRSVQLAKVHAGNYTIAARTADNIQYEEAVFVKEVMNKFSIYYTPQGVPLPGAPVARPMPRPSPSRRVGSIPSRPLPGGAGSPTGQPITISKDDEEEDQQSAGEEVYVPHMGIYYSPVPYADGTFGARLTRDAAPGTPAGQIQLSTGPSRLEQGDTIFEMDGLRFRTPADVRNHRAYTTMRFIDVRTGRTYGAAFNLP
jgi:hypothetical protein